MNHIKIDLERIVGGIDPNIFGGFSEHVGHCIYGGIYDPDSPLADKDGLRSDVLATLRRLNYSNVRWPGGNFASQYRWRDGIGPKQERPSSYDLSWGQVESNQFGTDEFIQFCRKLNIEPYLCVNCGDGDMREASDWVEYCNGTADTTLVKLRHKHGFEKPHKVKYWGIGNEVDGVWQVGYKTPQEYARAITEFAKVMKRVDPNIKIVASAASFWDDMPVKYFLPDAMARNLNVEWVERAQLMLQQAGDFIDYMSIHRYYHPKPNDPFETFVVLSELFEEHISAYEGLIHAVCLEKGIKRHINIAVDEYGILYFPRWMNKPQSMADAMVTAMCLNSFIRHANSVRMANLTFIMDLNVPEVSSSPIAIRPDGLLLQSTFYPFELYRRTCGQKALDVFWNGESFAAITYLGRGYSGIRTLDVSATLDELHKQLVIYVVNRSQAEAMETTISLADGQFAESIKVSVVNGPDINAENTFDKPNQVGIQESTLKTSGKSFIYSFEPHSVTALICSIK